MFVMEFLSWWYGPGWQRLGQNTLRHIQRSYQGFSVSILLRTLFEPWRRIISTNSETIVDKFRSVIDNLISRCVGFVVRIFALIAAGIIIAGTAIFGAAAVLVWPLVPLSAIILIVWGAIR
jgi:hypothetical protein